jgi:hypothetical protein
MPIVERITEADVSTLQRAIRGVLNRLDAIEKRALSQSRAQVLSTRNDIEAALPAEPTPADVDAVLRTVDSRMSSLANSFEGMVAAFSAEAGTLGEEFASVQLKALGLDPAKYAGQGLSSTEIAQTARTVAAEARSVIGATSARIQADVARAFLQPKTSATKIRAAIRNSLRTTKQEGSLSGAMAEIARKLRSSLGSIFSMASDEIQKAGGEDEELGKVWIEKPPNVRPTHHQAAVSYRIGGKPGPIPLDEPFVVGGVELRFPRDPQAVSVGGSIPAQIERCKCESAVVPMPKSKRKKQSA